MPPHPSHGTTLLADVVQYAWRKPGPVEFIHPSDGTYPPTCYQNGTLLTSSSTGARSVSTTPSRITHDSTATRRRSSANALANFHVRWRSVNGGPEEIFNEMKMSLAVNIANDHANWLNASAFRQQPSCPEEIGHRGASLGDLTIITYRQGKNLTWDPQKEIFPNNDAANRLLTKPKRAPWQL